jgi:OOP family OmpA-OmpF porin
VLSERCTKNGQGHSADAGAGTAAGNGSYKNGSVEVTVKKDGTGVYNAPGIHVAVLPDGSGVYEHGDQRLSVEPDGSGTWVDGDKRLTIRADGSGSWSDGDERFWVGPDGSGGYRDTTLRVSVTAAGVSTGNGSQAQLIAVQTRVRSRFNRFAPVPAVHRVKPTGKVCGTVIRLDANALFALGSSDLTPDTTGLVDKVAALLTVLKPKTIQVNGYTDHLGGTASNLELSRRRATSVATELSTRGVSRGSIQVRGFGEADPLGPETTPSGADDPAARQLDRRVEIVLPD